MEMEQPLYIEQMAHVYEQPEQSDYQDYQDQDTYADPQHDSDTDSGGEGKGLSMTYKSKPRRKATQRPVGSDQKRQAFSKRKRGIVLKAYQLYKLTDAKVFMFVVNDKGSSWAYASPSFGSCLHPSHLRRMRELARLPHSAKHTSEVMPHPRVDEADRSIDDRHMYVGAHDTLPPGLPIPIPIPQPSDSNRDGSLKLERSIRTRPPPASTTTSNQPSHGSERVRTDRLPLQQQPSLQGAQQQDPHQDSLARGGRYPQLQVSMPDDGFPDAAQCDTIITPTGRALAAAVGLPLPLHNNNNMNTNGGRAGHGMSVQGTSGSGTSEQQAHTMAFNNNGYSGQIVTDSAGNMYRVVHQDTAPPPSMAPPPVPLPVHRSHPPTQHPQHPQMHHGQHPQHLMHMPPAPKPQQQQHAPRIYHHMQQQQQQMMDHGLENPSGLAALAAAAAVANGSQQSAGGAGGYSRRAGMKGPPDGHMDGMKPDDNMDLGMMPAPVHNNSMGYAVDDSPDDYHARGEPMYVHHPHPQQHMQHAPPQHPQHMQHAPPQQHPQHMQHAPQQPHSGGHVTFVGLPPGQRPPPGYQLQQHPAQGGPPPPGMMITGYMPGELQPYSNPYPHGPVMLVPGDWGGSGGVMPQCVPDGWSTH